MQQHQKENKTLERISSSIKMKVKKVVSSSSLFSIEQFGWKPVNWDIYSTPNEVLF